MQESTAGNVVGMNLANLFVPLKIDEKTKKETFQRMTGELHGITVNSLTWL